MAHPIIAPARSADIFMLLQFPALLTLQNRRFPVKNCIIGAINKLGGETLLQRNETWKKNDMETEGGASGEGQLQLKIVAQVAIHGLPLADTRHSSVCGAQSRTIF